MADYANQNFLHEPIDATVLGDVKIGVITAKWNSQVTSKLKEGAINTLSKSGLTDDNIIIWDVPGTYELIYAANQLAVDCDAVICLGVVIQGETRHFDFICDAVANGLANVTIKHSKPVAFGVLTTDNLEQALERAGGTHGHKGEEAATTVLQLLLKK